jgi:membrane associated rhomboid family serine protease
LGASGAVSAVVFAKILIDPITGIGMFFIPVYVAGFIFGIIYILVSRWMDKKNMDNVNHSAHIFGALFGVAFTIVACLTLSEYPIITAFVDQIKNMDPGKIIQVSSRSY